MAHGEEDICPVCDGTKLLLADACPLCGDDDEDAEDSTSDGISSNPSSIGDDEGAEDERRKQVADLVSAIWEDADVKLSVLKKKALEVGASEDDIDEALDQTDMRAALKNIIMDKACSLYVEDAYASTRHGNGSSTFSSAASSIIYDDQSSARSAAPYAAAAYLYEGSATSDALGENASPAWAAAGSGQSLGGNDATAAYDPEARRRRALEAAEKRQYKVKGISEGKVAEMRETQAKAELLAKIHEYYYSRKMDLPMGLNAASATALQLKKHLDAVRNGGPSAASAVLNH